MVKRHPWIVGFGAFAWAAAVWAEPVLVATTSDYGAPLGLPRWKMALSTQDPSTLWFLFAKRTDTFVKSIDGGLTWNATEPDALDPIPRLDFHAAMWRDERDDLHIVSPAYDTPDGYR